MNVVNIINLIALLIFILGLLLWTTTMIKSKNNQINPHPINLKDPKIAILIPARDESKVIEALLRSLKNQTHAIKSEDIYVIVEDINDKTVNITKQYHNTIIVRKDLKKKRKGYALDEAIKEILSNQKHYDLYFIFDADNMLKENYIEKMLETYQQGYDIATSYRNNKNPDTTISICSSLIFTIMNNLINIFKVKHHGNVIISGTGYYIKGALIEDWQEFPFHSLTEDYEISLYANLHGLTTYYNQEAEFYDEQPTSFRVSKDQRTRWIKGFFEARKKYIKKMKEKRVEKSTPNKGSQYAEEIGVLPYILVIVSILFALINNILSTILFLVNDLDHWKNSIIMTLLIILTVYIILCLITLILLKIEKPKMPITGLQKIKVVLFNPIFLVSFIPCALKALFQKEIEWKKIEHNVEKIK